MLGSEISLLEKEIALFENERYSPISGWSKRGLMPTDRGNFSNDDGSESFSTMEEASESFLSPGWKWKHDEWDMVKGSYCDENGWSYSPDFGSFDKTPGSAIKGMMHFVRRRKYTRPLMFDVNFAFPLENGTCDHCDLYEIARMSGQLLDSIVSISLFHFPRSTSIKKINSVKCSVFRALGCTKDSYDVKIEPYGKEAIDSAINAIMNEGRSTWSAASASLMGANSLDGISKRKADIMSYFPPEERIEFAKLMIRKYDIGFDYHCNKPHCGDTCIFCPVQCGNDGCQAVVSRKWLASHDDICDHKIIDCNRLCGEKVRRGDMQTHLAHACALRPAECPFQHIGCTAEITMKDLSDHLEKCVHSHLLLAVNRMQEQQDVIVVLHRKVKELEEIVDSHSSQLAGVQAEIAAVGAAATAALLASEKKTEKNINNHVNNLDKKINGVGSRHDEEIQKLKKMFTK